MIEFIINLVSTRTSSSFYAELLSSWCLELFLSRTSHFSSSNSMRLLLAFLPSLSKFLWMIIWPSSQSAIPFSFMSSANLLGCTLAYYPDHSAKKMETSPCTATCFVHTDQNPFPIQIHSKSLCVCTVLTPWHPPLAKLLAVLLHQYCM